MDAMKQVPLEDRVVSEESHSQPPDEAVDSSDLQMKEGEHSHQAIDNVHGGLAEAAHNADEAAEASNISRAIQNTPDPNPAYLPYARSSKKIQMFFSFVTRSVSHYFACAYFT